MEEKKWVHGGFGKRVPKSKENPKGWEEGSFEDVKINTNKKNILYFNGNQGVNAKTANFGAKFVESLIGKAEENNYDLFSFYYGHQKNTDAGIFSSVEKEQIFCTFIQPFLCDVSGELFSEEQIEHNLQNLCIYAYCQGMQETNVLLGKANNVLLTKFDVKKARALLENVVIVSFAPYVEPRFGTNIEFKSLQDNITQEPWFISKNASDFDGSYPYTGLAQVEFNKRKNGLEVFSNDLVAINSKRNPHNIKAFLKEKGVIEKNVVLRDDTGKKIYSRQQAISDMMGTCLAYGIVNNKPNLNDIQKMLKVQIKKDESVIFEQEQKEIFKNKTKIKTNTQNGMVLG